MDKNKLIKNKKVILHRNYNMLNYERNEME